MGTEEQITIEGKEYDVDFFGKRQLEEIRLAQRQNWEVKIDTKRGHLWCKYKRENAHVWSLGYAWRRAELIDGKFCFHTTHATLFDAFGCYNVLSDEQIRNLKGS